MTEGVQEFRGDDAGYEAWLRSHPSGWVVNTPRSPKASYIKLHAAACAHVKRLQAGYATFTSGEYIKVCAVDRGALDDWAAATVGGPLQTGCRCCKGAAPQPPAPASTSARPVETHSSSVPILGVSLTQDADGPWVIMAPKRPGFQAKTDADRQTKRTVAEALGRIVPNTGEVLYASIDGPLARGVDLDNALLNDMGGPQSVACCNGVLLERHPDVPITGVRYRYGTTSVSSLRSYCAGPTLARFLEVPLTHKPLGWQDVWLALKTNDVEIPSTAPTGDVVVTLTIHGPVSFCGSQLSKWLIDGVLVALHHHTDPIVARQVSTPIAARVGAEPVTVAAWLLDDRQSALGPRPKLVVPFGATGVQCHPDDGRVAAVRIDIDRGTSTYALSGAVALAVSR